MTDEELTKLIRDMHDDVAQRIGNLQQTMIDDFGDVLRRQDQMQAELTDIGRRVSSVEQAIIRLLNVTPIKAA